MSINSFGRIVAPPDARDMQFLMRTARPQIAAVAKPAPRKTAYHLGPVLDQGDTPMCVGFSTRSFIEAAPIMTKPTQGPSAQTIYRLAQQNDEWPGTRYDGTSVRGAMKALQAAKQITSYVWGQTVDDMAKWMTDGYGTCVLGTNWYAEMSDVDNAGVMREPAPSMTTPIGGHAWHVYWFDVKKNMFLMKNSWGFEFGMIKNKKMSGEAYVRKDFMARLLREEGEVAAPVQAKVVATPLY